MSMRRCLWTLLLFLLAFVSRANAGDCPKPDLKSNVTLSDAALLQNNFPEGSKVTLKCANGYVVDQGSNTITCVSGEWSKQELTCKKKDCGLPKPSPSMQYHIPNGTFFGAYVTPVCDRGYRLEGSSHKQCLRNGWTGRSKCLLITCGPVLEIEHSIIVSHPDKEVIEFEDVIKYSCEAKYTLVGSESVVCQENGTYSLLPQCKGDCSKPDLKSNVTLSDAALLQNNFPEGSKVTLKCANGYVVDQGSNTITCVSGEWSKQELTCKMITCGPVPEIEHSIIVSHPGKEVIEFEDVIKYSCEAKYTLVGSESVVCQENGTYSLLPQCKVRDSDGKHVSPYRIPSAIVIAVFTFICFCIFIYFLVQCYQKRKGSYDTGEEQTTKEGLMQETSISYFQYDCEFP